MNKSDVTKSMVIEVVNVFNKELLEKEDALPTGKKRGETLDKIKVELVETADAILEDDDEGLFTEKMIEVMRVLGVKRFQSDSDEIENVEEETNDSDETENEEGIDEEVEEETKTECECKEKDAQEKPKEDTTKKTGKGRGKGKGKKAVTENTTKKKVENKTSDIAVVEKDKYGFKLDSIMHKVALVVEGGKKKGVTVKDIRDAEWNVRKDSYKSYWMKMVDNGFAEFKDGKITIIK